MAFVRHIRTATCLALLALGTAPAGAQEPGAPAPTSTGAGSPAAELVDCHVAVDQSARYATFAGQMEAGAGGVDRLAMRVDLQERDPGAGSRFHDVSAPNLGIWRRSASGVGALRYVKQVTDLPAPAAFRVVITFRWLDAQGRPIRRAVRRSPVCVQPDERPRLRAEPVTAAPSSSGGVRYDMPILNDGRGPAGSFDVVLNVNGADQPPVTVAALDAGQRTIASQVAARCAPGSQIAVTVDPTHQVPEAGGGGQKLTQPCPVAATSKHSSS